jgi:hypothetical protein
MRKGDEVIVLRPDTTEISADRAVTLVARLKALDTDDE